MRLRERILDVVFWAAWSAQMTAQALAWCFGEDWTLVVMCVSAPVIVVCTAMTVYFMRWGR